MVGLCCFRPPWWCAEGVRMCVEGVLIFYTETIVFIFLRFTCQTVPALRSNRWRAVRSECVIDLVLHAHKHTHTVSTISQGGTGPRGLRSVPSDPGDLRLCPVSPARVDWSLGRWGSVCPPVRETQECTVVFIVWLPGLVKRVMISNDISSARHTHHLLIRGRKVNGW